VNLAGVPVCAMSNGDASGASRARPWVATVLVNWRGADDTIECLESLLTSDYPQQCVIVVDNGSRDGSLAKLARWASGQVTMRPRGKAWGEEVPRTCGKPVPFVVLDAHAALGGHAWHSGSALVFIDAGRNRGFAGGVNIGVRFALTNAAVRYVWVLNNDTVVARDCLSRMERRMAESPAGGMCGSRILFYDQPDRVQVLGGARFRPWKGTSRLIGSLRSASEVVDPREVERDLDHLSGASMLVARTFLEDVGLMEESYFLYFEEIDWAIRGRGRYRLAYADDAVVYHKEGASIGSSHQRSKTSALSSFFMVRSRLRFTRRFYPWAVPSVIAFSWLLTLRAVLNGQREQANAMWAALIGSDPAEALGWTPDRVRPCVRL
jgi:GT2 family glycosyltransferase